MEYYERGNYEQREILLYGIMFLYLRPLVLILNITSLPEIVLSHLFNFDKRLQDLASTDLNYVAIPHIRCVSGVNTFCLFYGLDVSIVKG